MAIQLPSKAESQSRQSVNGGRIGTPHFMAPEVIQRKAYGKPVDVWSTGVLLHILLSGTMPFLGTKDRLYETVCTGKLYLNSDKWSYVSDSAKDLIRGMLRVDPDERMTVDQALKHPWISDRERFASKVHLNETVEELKKFNSRRKLKGAVLAAVSSPKWIYLQEADTPNGGGDGPNGHLNSIPGVPTSSNGSSGGSDFGADDEITSAAVGLVLDSLDDIHCLLEAKNRDGDFLSSVLQDPALHSLLNLYDQISTNNSRPFRNPPSDACTRLRDVLNVIEFFDEEDLDEVDELRDILTHYHMRSLLQSHDVVSQEVYGEDAIRVTPPPTLQPNTQCLNVNSSLPPNTTTRMSSLHNVETSLGGPNGDLNSGLPPPMPGSRGMAGGLGGPSDTPQRHVSAKPRWYQFRNQNAFFAFQPHPQYPMPPPPRERDREPANLESVTRVRLVQFQRNTDEPMGITLKLSDDGKCVVGRIMHGGMIHRQVKKAFLKYCQQFSSSKNFCFYSGNSSRRRRNSGN